MLSGGLAQGIAVNLPETPSPLADRRRKVFVFAVVIAALSASLLCLTPLFLLDLVPQSLFADSWQESFFFDSIGWTAGLWLMSFTGALCGRQAFADIGQWLGIILLSFNQVLLMALWVSFLSVPDNLAGGVWVALTLLQTFFIGWFLCFFTMPALVLSGKTSLAAMGTLVLLLPWLLGREGIILGTRYLAGWSA